MEQALGRYHLGMPSWGFRACRATSASSFATRKLWTDVAGPKADAFSEPPEPEQPSMFLPSGF